ncbi:hypothetical protein AA309_08950 [Microvirga vignae]|uniref:Uncharacterized protein n=1 Tax=Microvirga vignae TaxID=1225564 RepID=A0A0H1RE31_9HYPH|nr:hypothetical protein [Microvirga vignae]KLK93438.1 hypothetical protein AA309_08950 [Microvirga vignae]
MILSDTPAHRFKVGDRVWIVRSSSGNAAEAFLELVTLADAAQRPQQIWEVVRLRPADEIGFQYHVKACENGQERLVREGQLAPAE